MEKKDIPARQLRAARLKHYLHLKAELDSALRKAEQSKQKLFTAVRTFAPMRIFLAKILLVGTANVSSLALGWHSPS
jgi:hypothetical protein